jgi:GNAT superfamily N-acetyltransferase
MDLIATVLGQDRIEIVEADPRCPDAIHCLGQYYAELERRFDTGFDVNLSRDPDAADMIRPRGVFLLAMSDGLPIGCVGLKGSGAPVAEIKRLWVSPAARGLQLATRLMTRAEDAARDLGIGTLRLDTNSALPEAAALYRKTGWTEIDRFNDDPYAQLFFEKRL